MANEVTEKKQENDDFWHRCFNNKLWGINMALIADNLLRHCNERFGTNVSKRDFGLVFDIYDSEDEFNECVGDNEEEEDFDTIRANDMADIIDGKYVFFNECNYDWNEDTAISYD